MLEFGCPLERTIYSAEVDATEELAIVMAEKLTMGDDVDCKARGKEETKNVQEKQKEKTEMAVSDVHRLASTEVSEIIKETKNTTKIFEIPTMNEVGILRALGMYFEEELRIFFQRRANGLYIFRLDADDLEGGAGRVKVSI